MRLFFQRLGLIACLLFESGLAAAERIPPAPASYFNDYAGAVSAGAADDMNRQLQQYERDSSNQLLVVVYRKMESDSSVEDYTVRVAEAWKVGQKGRNNGAVLFVFKDDHKLYIQVGYGLEPTLTDARAHEIVENILKPRFRQGNFEAGLREAVDAMIAATKGEYQGTGRTHGSTSRSPGFGGGNVFFILLIGLFVVISVIRSFGRAAVYTGRRRRGLGGIWLGGGGGSSGGWSGGGGGGGGFSGGGGSFGGGGAGGSW
ncbi:MAG: hypothetical protein JWQ62_1913 [Lacunisphaera sp.]|nr:hypothetical protein [Lacunisphaera sp.]